MRFSPIVPSFLALGLASFGCSGGEFQNATPADVGGLYALTLRNAANGCAFEDWTDGATATNIELSLTQDGTSVVGTLEGIAGGLAALRLGTAEFNGTVSGSEVTLEAYSGYVLSEGACIYNLVVTFDGAADGNVISGTVTYTYATNDAPDCGALEQCASTQAFDAVKTSP